MRQLLIVDDELIAVEGLKTGVDWSGIGISKVLTAYSPDQAKEIFEQERIDVMLCDIEMPQGTGLELLEWVRKHHAKTETIFLTCHADFHYAKQAIQLGSLDYLLKPIPFKELEEVVKRAIFKLEQESRLSEFSTYGKFWVQHQPMLVERFWLDILDQSIPSDRQAIKKAAEERNIPYSEEITFLPILIHIRRRHKEISLRDEKVMEYALRKSAEELLLVGAENGFIVSRGNGYMLAMMNGEAHLSQLNELQERCARYIEACRNYFYTGVSCYIGDRASGHEMSAMFQKLLKLDANNVAYDQKVFHMQDYQPSPVQYLLPDMSVWAVLLEEGGRIKVLDAAESYVMDQVRENRLTPDLLNQFIQDFQQMVYYVLKVKGIQAHQLLGDRSSMALYAASARSATDTLAWTRHITDKAMDFVASIEQSESVVDKAKAYIRRNLAEDLSRENIASHVYLNPDYLTRIFKKETGLSISDYLLQQRLDIAAELLESTDSSVSAIGAKIGYANFSHFSRMFKKHKNMNPLEYRNSRQQAAASESRESGSKKS